MKPKTCRMCMFYEHAPHMLHMINETWPYGNPFDGFCNHGYSSDEYCGKSSVKSTDVCPMFRYQKRYFDTRKL